MAGTNGCLDWRCRSFPFSGQVSAEWSRCLGSIARNARESVVLLRRSSAGWMAVRIGRLSAGVGHMDQVTIHEVSLMTRSVRQV